MKANYEKVIVALDFESIEKACRLVDEVSDVITSFKVGPILFTRSGAEIINYLHRKGKRIFLDLKLYDTPNIAAETIRQIGDMGVHFATVHCLGGRTMLEAASLACRGTPLKLLGVTLLTSHLASDSKDLGWPQSDSGMVLRLLDAALDARLAGILCSPHEIKEVRERTLPGFLLVTPGIRIPKQEVFMDDQKRVASPKESVEWGADFIVVGRPITQAREPREVVEHLFD